MFLELQGVVEIDEIAHWEYRVFMLSGDIVLWYEPTSAPDRSARDILGDANALYLHETNDEEGA